MTAREVAELIDRPAVYSVPRTELQFNVMIRDVKSAFGRTDVLVEPVSGEGQQWVSRDSVVVA